MVYPAPSPGAALARGPRARIERPLVDRAEEHLIGFVEGVLSAIAVVDVPIDDQHPVQTASERVRGGNGHRIEQTESHAPGRGGMVPRRPGQDETTPCAAVECRLDGGDACPGGERGDVDRLGLTAVSASSQPPPWAENSRMPAI